MTPFKKSKLFQELAEQPNVKFLSKKETKKLLADTEFNGCVARPKTTKKNKNKENPQ